jgi:hypothetical protein
MGQARFIECGEILQSGFAKGFSIQGGETKPKAALDDIYQAWEQITERYGRDNQKKLYAESYASS